MALTEETYIDKAEVLADGQIQVREAIVVYEDGNEITRSFHRYVLDPARDDASSVAAKTNGRDTKIDINTVVSEIWTPEVVNARIAFLEAQRNENV